MATIVDVTLHDTMSIEFTNATQIELRVQGTLAGCRRTWPDELFVYTANVDLILEDVIVASAIASSAQAQTAINQAIEKAKQNFLADNQKGQRLNSR